MHNTEWIDAYLEDPYDALKSDENLVILNILSDLGKNSESLQLNDKKLRKMRKNLKKLSEEFLRSFKDEQGKPPPASLGCQWRGRAIGSKSQPHRRP